MKRRKQKGELLPTALAILVWACTYSCDDPMKHLDSTPLDDFAAEREAMVRRQIESRGVRDRRVLAAMRAVPRHLFVPERYRSEAYRDGPLPIGHNQTISQPYIVALMTELLKLKGGERVLEIGTGSGYQAAVLAKLSGEVYSIEIVEPLCFLARAALAPAEYPNVKLRCGDGYRGWPEAAPFDGIIVTAAPPKLPQPLVDQLKIGGRLVVPIGDFEQDLIVYTKSAKGLAEERIIPVRFVPMTGEAQKDN